MIKKLVRWTERFAEHKHSELALFLVAFAESSFFLIPPDVLIIAILAHHVKKSWVKIASNATLGSLLGGIAGYAIGHYLYHYVGEPIVTLYGVQNQVNEIGIKLRDNAFWFIILLSFTPFPYKIVTITSGIFGVNVWEFLIASFIGRSKRFFLVAYLSHRYGERAKRKLLETDEKRVWITLVIIILILYFIFR